MVKKQQKKNKKFNIKVLLKNKKLFLAYILIAIAVIYCFYKVFVLIQNPTDTFTVEQGKIYQEEANTGYIIREETVVKGSNYKNGMSQIKTEGERVAKNEAIFRYYSNNEENLVKKIAELDEKIDEAMNGQTELLSSDIK